MANRRQPRSFWIGLKSLIRRHPRSAGLVLFSAFSLFSLAFGVVLCIPGLPADFTLWFDSSGVFLTWFSMCAGWVAVVMGWGRGKGAVASFERIGSIESGEEQDLVGFLILAPPGYRPEHLLRQLELPSLCGPSDSTESTESTEEPVSQG